MEESKREQPDPSEEPISMLESDEEDNFQDALDIVQAQSFHISTVPLRTASIRMPSVRPGELGNLVMPEAISEDHEEDDEPLEREELPWLKDPNAKISIWAIIKDSIGKGDLSKMSVPVYFNDPTSLL